MADKLTRKEMAARVRRGRVQSGWADDDLLEVRVRVGVKTTRIRVRVKVRVRLRSRGRVMVRVRG